ncbi:MAG: hypothetical protein IJ538_03040 [Clostridia bacterium]|nr:hypothetical protein [Clostridia bacterium]
MTILSFIFLFLFIFSPSIYILIYCKKKKKQPKQSHDGWLDGVYCYYREQLSNTDKIFYDVLYDTLKNLKHNINFLLLPKKVRFSSNENKILIYKCLKIDHPEIFYTLPVYQLTEIEYTENVNAKIIQVEAEATKILNLIKGKTDFEKIKFVYNYLRKNTTYKYGAKNFFLSDDSAYTIYGCLVNHNAVCSGIANAFKFILDRANVKCKIIHGYILDSQAHAWNQVFIDGKWKHVDVTWDLNNEENKYFLIDDNLLSKSRLWANDMKNYSYKELLNIKNKNH